MEAEAVNKIYIEDEMRQSYMDYAMSVIIGRALPSVRDGLKPVQRRVLYAMFSEGLLSTRKTSKCAGVVGEVLKRFHPHGDSSVYDALVRLAQPWNMRYPLIDGQGNFGSIDGDPPAAYRYTECRMTALAELLLTDIDKNTVDFSPNFDDSSTEPDVLPSLWPNLLVNGANGIAVGMATHIPPHNLTEVINGTIALIEDASLTSVDLMEHIPAPDFPTGGVICGVAPIKQAYVKGRGVVKIRATSHVETLKRKSREVEAIVVTEIPFQVNKARLLEKIASLVNEKNIEGISDIRDESDREGMRIVLEIKRDATSEVVLNQLYKLTPLRSSFGIINLAIVEGKPVVCSLKELLNHFIDHRRDVVTRRTVYTLDKARARMHILEGYRIALLHIDEVIELIKKSETPKDAKSALIERFELSSIQSQAILDLRLQKLTGMERLAIDKEHGELAEEIERLLSILADPKKVDALIVTELTEIREKFGDPRRSQIEETDDADFDMVDLIEDEEMVVTVSHKGYLKRTSVSEYRAQKRGGKGSFGAASKDDDFIEHLFAASTHSTLLVFTNLGRLYWLKVYQIPETSKTARGRALVNLLDLKEDEKLTAVLPIREFNDNMFVVMGTKQGYVKKIELNEFSRPRKGGVYACTLGDDDSLIRVALCAAGDDIMFATKEGLAIRFSEDDVRPMGRAARGVIGIRLDENDEAVGMAVIAGPDSADEATGRVSKDGTLLTVCSNGYGKRSNLEDYRTQKRGGKGVIDIQTVERNGPVAGVAVVSDDCGSMIITSGGKIIRFNASDVSIIGRNTKGVRLIGLDEEEYVAAIGRLAEKDENGTNGDAE
ncbi:MAG: DNA gyrase subunit A [Bdellovibrionales bacterium]|nr:DNA gyrase subunit A [Bdellovibrionales bacterium]